MFIAMHHEQPTIDGPALDKLNVAWILDGHFLVVIPIDPDHGTPTRLLDEPRDDLLILGRQWIVGFVNDVTIEHQTNCIGQLVDKTQEILTMAVTISQMDVTDDLRIQGGRSYPIFGRLFDRRLFDRH